MALVVPIAGMIGFFTGAIVEGEALSQYFMVASPLLRLTVPLAMGSVCAGLMAVVIWRTFPLRS